MPMVVKVNEQALAGIDPKEVAIARKVLSLTHANLRNQLGDTDD